MATLFHEGRKVLRAEIKNNNYADIADFIYFRIQVSKYKDDKDNTFFLLPNIDYLVKETGISKRTCERALQELVKNDFISKAKLKCYDGAVRIKIFITNKFKQLMLSISNLVTKNNSKNEANDQVDLNENISENVAESDSVNLAESIIKEEDYKKDNNINNDKYDNVINVNFYFSCENKESHDLAEYLSQKYNLDCLDILFALHDLQQTGLYKCKHKLIEDAISSVQRNTNAKDVIPTGEVFNSYKAIQVAEDTREETLTPKQQIAIHQMLKYLTNKGKTIISNVKEVFSWIEFQVTNMKHQLVGLGFKHCLNIIRKLLCDNSKHQYSKPIGYRPLSKSGNDDSSNELTDLFI
ncbi:hypothetical protein [Francisella sp. SYW-2]|uniref:hypothetical protein n=1 Tax=Francisella sp. SYW-2 TaxID=2610886 RepID=UPI00123CD1AB|nr:hypothetical protein [Francisella sp. SYW-2]